MEIFAPEYYHRFRCIAADCPDSCCQLWDVAVDQASAWQYLAVEGPLGQSLRQHLKQDEDGDYYFEILDNRCPFWQADGLCRIQAEAGHEALCETCRDFPRLTHDYGDFVEKGLCLSCPEAARLILADPAPQWGRVEASGGEAPEYDLADMQILLESRQALRAILSDTSFSVPEALAQALLYAYEAQGALDAQVPVEPWIPVDVRTLAARSGKREDPGELLGFYRGLEILTDRWRQLLEDPRGGEGWDEGLRALARYGIDRYWLQAISDLDLVGRAKMVICSCLVVYFLGGQLTQTAQLYAKEIENDPDNVEAILDGAYTSPALTDDKILGWLLL